jgi:hypothetical protein
MKRPRDLRHRRMIRGEVVPMWMWCNVPIASSIARQPREWRRAAAWLRRVADWWEFLADQQAAKEEGR